MHDAEMTALWTWFLAGGTATALLLRLLYRPIAGRATRGTHISLGLFCIAMASPAAILSVLSHANSIADCDGGLPIPGTIGIGAAIGLLATPLVAWIGFEIRIRRPHTTAPPSP